MTATSTTANEASDTAAALSSLHLDVVRTGAGSGPSALQKVNLDGLDMFSAVNGFPVIGQLTLADDVIAVTLFTSAPPGTRWSEVDITTGDVLVYGPGTLHTATSPEGTHWSAVVIERSVLDAVADSLKTTYHRPARGAVRLLNPGPGAADIASELVAMGSPVARRNDLPATGCGVLRAVVNALDASPDAGTSRRTRAIQSRHIVNECVQYADALGRGPSVPELCAIAHISERRLRAAFHDTFSVPPNAFFRTRNLSHARDQLVIGDRSVTEVALDLGFEHLGRFARRYAEIYGEHPRDTVARGRSTVDLRARLPTTDAPGHANGASAASG